LDQPVSPFSVLFSLLKCKQQFSYHLKIFSSKNILLGLTFKQTTKMASDYQTFISSVQVGNEEIKFYDLKKLGQKFDKLPFSIRILLESAIRNCDDFQVRIKKKKSF
jgi:hypothetical protein